MAYRMLAVALVVFVSTLLPRTVRGCSCVPPEKYDKTYCNLIGNGNYAVALAYVRNCKRTEPLLTGIPDSADEVCNVDVYEVYKRQTSSNGGWNKKVQVVTAASDALCGLSIQEKQIYVFAGMFDRQQKQLRVASCGYGWNVPVGAMGSRELAFLDKLHKQPNESECAEILEREDGPSQ